MRKRYLINNKEETLFINDFVDIVYWWHEKKQIDVSYKINTDENNRKFIVIKGQTVYLDENLTLTIEECKELASKGKLKQDEFVNAVLKAGVENVRLLINCKKITGYLAGILPNYAKETYLKECYFDETYTLRKVSGNYKVMLEAVDPLYRCKNDWYLSDLVSFINAGEVKIL